MKNAVTRIKLSVMSDRKQEINLQVQQITDGLLLLLSFCGSFAINHYVTVLFGWEHLMTPFTEFHWMIPVIIPFGLIALHLAGFYNVSPQKALQKSLLQMLQAALWICLLLGGCVIFFRLQVPGRSVLLIFAALAVTSLTIRERLTVLHRF